MVMIIGFVDPDASHSAMCGCPGFAATALIAALSGMTFMTSDVTPPIVYVVALVCSSHQGAGSHHGTGKLLAG